MARGLLVCMSIIAATQAAVGGEMVLTVSDPGGLAAAVGAPGCVAVEKIGLAGPDSGQWRLVELNPSGEPVGQPIPAQLDGSNAQAAPGASPAVLWWFLPPGKAETRRFRLLAAEHGKTAVHRSRVPVPPRPSDPSAAPLMQVLCDGRGDRFLFCEGDVRVLRYNHGPVPPPPAIDPKYTRGDYIHPLYGPEGQILTEDYPKDHPHHRGVSWSWPVTRWKDEVRDIWAVVGVWSRPVAVRAKSQGPVFASLIAENVWKWADQVPIVRETVLIRAFRHTAAGRFVDIEVRLESLQEGVAIGGRPHAGYGGFGLRAAPTQQQKIALHRDPHRAQPRRSWIDYSGQFAGATPPCGVAIFEHPANPGYPNELLQYPELNYVMPAFPGQREVPLPKGQTLVLRHRLWIHPGAAPSETLRAVWTTYAHPPRVEIHAR